MTTVIPRRILPLLELEAAALSEKRADYARRLRVGGKTIRKWKAKARGESRQALFAFLLISLPAHSSLVLLGAQVWSVFIRFASWAAALSSAQTRSAKADISAFALRQCDVARLHQCLYCIVIAIRKVTTFTWLRSAVEWSFWTRRALLFRSRLFLISISAKTSILAQWHAGTRRRKLRSRASLFTLLTHLHRHPEFACELTALALTVCTFTNMFMFLNCSKIRSLSLLLILVSTQSHNKRFSKINLIYESIKFVEFWFCQRFFVFESRHLEAHEEEYYSELTSAIIEWNTNGKRKGMETRTVVLKRIAKESIL